MGICHHVFFSGGYGRHRHFRGGFRTGGYGRHRRQWVKVIDYARNFSFFSSLLSGIYYIVYILYFLYVCPCVCVQPKIE